MADTPLSKVRRLYRQLKNDQVTWQKKWADARDFVVPERGRGIGGSLTTSEVNKGNWDDTKRLNGVASRALEILANGMQSGLTSKARQWFLLSHPDPELSRYHVVREWYDKVQEIIEGIFSRSNLYSALLHTYTEMAAFGQGALAVMPHPERVLYCRPYTTGTYFLSADGYMDIDTFIHTEYLTVRQIVEIYGEDKLPQNLKNAYANGRYEDRVEVVNAIFKNPQTYGIPVKEDFPVASVHFLERANDRDEFLRVAHYRSFPVMTPRWNAIDCDVYGVAPLWNCIGDIKMIQSMEADVLKGIKKSVSPPLRIPPELERRGVDTRPNALNVVSAMAEQAVAPLYTQQIQIQQLQAKIDAVEAGIRDGMYNSLFLALLTQDNPQMTAREVAERHEEKLLMLGPVLERIHLELLNPLIDRAFLIAHDAGMIPPAPRELEGQPTQIEYVSILSQAQKAVGVNRIEQSLGFLSGAAQLYPELIKAVDPFKMYGEYNRMIGVRADIFREDEEVQKMLAEDAQKQELAQQIEMGAPLAEAAKNLGDTDMTNIQQMLTGMGGGMPL